jgi:hypothetical protein
VLPNTNSYSTDIDIQFGELSAMVGWCQDNCADDWGYKVIDYAGLDPGKYQFNFENKADFINFILWKK